MLGLFRCILLLVAVANRLDEVLGAPPSIELAGKSYLITVDVLVTDRSKRNYLYKVQEYHSAWQKRSHVSYRTISANNESQEFPRTATLYSAQEQIVMRDEDSRVCREVSSEFADKLFNLNQLNSLERSSIVGPSRFLHFAATNTDGALGPNVSASQLSNRPAMDRFDYRIAGQSSIYSLYYFKDSTRNLPHGVPALLTLVIGNNETALLTYEIKRLDILPNQPLFGQSGSLNQQLDAQGNPVVLDWLAIPPFSGCDGVLRRISGTLTNPFSSEFRFSFKARTRDLSTLVGYEPAIKTLRVDRVAESRTTTTLNNFHTALTYHVIRRRLEHDNIMDELIEVNKNKKLDNDLLCIVTKASKRDKTLRLGAMLFGSSDLAYLGVAQVRGIEARAYVAYDSEWPVWFQQPIEYHTTTDWINASDTTKTRPPLDQRQDVILVTLIYLTYTEKEEEQLSGKLLMVEFQTIDKETLSRIETRSHHVYDFSWDFNGGSPTGGSSEQFFSLADSCSSPSAEDNHYGQIHLIMQHQSAMDEDEISRNDWLAQAPKRHFAIMSAAQQTCELPASMVYDIESRYQLTTTSDKETGVQRRLTVAASMRLIEHVRSLVQLIYIGRGTLKEGQWKKFQMFYVASFQTCYFIAAHKKVGLLFAFDPQKTLCQLYQTAVFGNAKLTIQQTFDINSTGQLEVYRIKHARNAKMGDEISALARSESRFQRSSRLILVDPTDVNHQLPMELKKVEASELDEKSATELDEQGFSDSNKFIGFGLVPADNNNRQIEPGRLISSDWQKRDAERTEKYAHMFAEMTFGQCQAACMADFECEAFSVCVKSAHIECVLSRVSFRSEVLLLQMLQTFDNQTKLNAEYDLILEDGLGRIKIKRQPGCELHNKLYSHFFTQTSRAVRMNLHQRALRPVRHRDECAKMCLNSTLSAIRDEVEEVRRVRWTALNDPESDLDSIAKLFTKYKDMHEDACSGFYYISGDDFLALAKSKRDLLERQIAGRSENDITNGYCILATSRTEHNFTKPGPPSRVEVPVERHNFDFSNLFEQQHGLSLVKSKMSREEKDAYLQLPIHSGASSFTRKQFDIMRQFVQRAENIVQSVMLTDAAECARRCFLEQAQIWPACRSFDVIEIKDLSKREVHCFMNSISVREALNSERFDLVRDKASEQEHIEPYHGSEVIRVTHYEPRTDFVAGSLNFAAQLMLDETYIERVAPFLQHGLQLDYFGLLVSILLALALGVASGVMLGVRVLIPRLRVRRDDTHTLVEPRTIEFSNLVNYEGHIPEVRAQVDDGPTVDHSVMTD